jgi:hypothetical protein
MSAPDVHAWLAAARSATLCTLLADDRDRGAPFGTAVPYALVDVAGAKGPVVLLSDLAVHTKNAKADARASLLVVEPGTADVQSGWRVTLVGRLRRLEGEAAIAAQDAYRARHPGPDLPGFAPWILDVTATRYIAGFGEMGWL